MSKRQKEKDPNAVCSVSSFTPRPMLRVGGGKDQGTRFLTFVDAMSGFRHLLTQEDIDKAASMCQGLKGHLRSRFIVISDDRQPPPPPSKKRPFADDPANDSPRLKRSHNFAPRTTPASMPPSTSAQYQGASVVATPASSIVPNQYIQGSTVPYQFHQGAVPMDTSNQIQMISSVPIPATGVVPSQFMSLVNPGQAIFSPNAFPPLQTPVTSQAPLLSQPIKVQVHGDGYQTVRSSRRSTPTPQGVERIKGRKPPNREGPKVGPTITEEQDPPANENDSHSDNSFVDAPDV